MTHDPSTLRPTVRSARAAFPLFRKEMTNSLRGLIGWTVGNIAAIALYLPFYPSIGANQDMQEFFTDFPPEVVTLFGLDQLYSGAAYTHATYFGLTAFLLLSIAAISWAAAAIAGDEESGGLELTLAHGVTRTQVVLERASALLVRVGWLALSGTLVIWFLNDNAQLDIGGAGLVGAALSLTGLVTFVGMTALFTGAATGRRSYSTAVGAGVAVLAYVLDALAKTSDLPWLGHLSPYRWAYGGSPITSGPDWPGLALLFGGAALLLLAAVAVFRRRDIGT